MQLVFAVAGLGLGLLLPQITVEPTVASSRVTETLVGVGFGVLGLVSIIFSLLFLVVQWAFSSLSPRLNLFRDDPVVWRTFGLAVGVFVFSVTAALVIGNDPEVSVIVPAVEVAGVLATLAMIRTLQVKAFASIQLAPTLWAIAAHGRAILDDLYPLPGPDGPHPAPRLPPLRRTVTWPGRQAVFQQLDLRRLAGASGTAVIVLRARIGDTLQEGAPAADLHGGDMTDATVLGAMVTGQERTFHQDPLLPSGSLPTSACERYRRPSTIRPPPFRSPWPPWSFPEPSTSREPASGIRGRRLRRGRCDRIPPHPCRVRRGLPGRRRIRVIRGKGRAAGGSKWHLSSTSQVPRFPA